MMLGKMFVACSLALATLVPAAARDNESGNGMVSYSEAGRPRFMRRVLSGRRRAGMLRLEPAGVDLLERDG